MSKQGSPVSNAVKLMECSCYSYLSKDLFSQHKGASPKQLEYVFVLGVFVWDFLLQVTVKL